MKIVEQSVELMEDTNGEAILWKIEAAARNCYKSEGRNAERSTEKRDALIRAAVKRGHTSVLEHGVVSFRVVCNRGVSHEWVRHRIGWSYSQESTRYCNYSHDQGESGAGITVIWPWYLGSFDITENPSYIRKRWVQAMWESEQAYLDLLDKGCKPEEARGVLPNDLKTEIVCTANIVALRHFFNLRCTKQAHPQIRDLALMLLERLYWAVPVLFDDLMDKFLTTPRGVSDGVAG